MRAAVEAEAVGVGAVEDVRPEEAGALAAGCQRRQVRAAAEAARAVAEQAWGPMAVARVNREQALGAVRDPA